MDTRRLFVALAAGLAIYLLYTSVYNRLRPLPPPDERPQPTATQPTTPGGPAASAPVSLGPPITTAPMATQARPPGEFAFTAAPEVATLTLGGGPEDKLEIGLTSRGAAVTSIKLSKRKNGKYVHRADLETEAPYTVVQPVKGLDNRHCSYLTRKIWMGEVSWPLDDLNWEVVEGGDYHAVFTTTLRSTDDGSENLQVTKTYELAPQSAVMQLRLKVGNLGGHPFELQLEQDGPVGVTREHLQYDMRKLVVARWGGEAVDPKAYARNDLSKEEKSLGSSLDEQRFLWTALANKYFAVFTRPLPREGSSVDWVQKVVGGVALTTLAKGEHPGDLLARIFTVGQELAPGDAADYTFEVYAGTKSEEDLENANPAYVDRKEIGYIAARDADQRCCCTFAGLTSLMTGLLEIIQTGVRNYGVAIIILVLIIRGLLHPLTVFQQKSMYRMQEAQARLQPKIAAIKEKYANDKVQQNRETMKLYRDEGVNPMASMIGMLPLLIQMPILVALWTALNTDVHLRHAGFDPWWITDLSAPDAFVEFTGDGITIPILGWLPLIGTMFTNIKALNLLPILMGVSMWLQQKYMPKPAMQAKLEAAKKTATAKKPGQKGSGLSSQDQLRQQQMIAYMMAIIFPLMFYKMPSGLNLYWMSTNVFGIVESLIIRRQLKADKERREREGPRPKVKKTGPLARLFQGMAAKAEQLQKRADSLAKEEAKRGGGKKLRGHRRR